DRRLLLRGLPGGQHALVEQPLLEAREAIVLGEQLDLFLRAISALVVFRGVGAEAVDQALDERRSFAGPCPRDGFVRDRIAGDRVASVDRDAREPVPRRPLRDMLDGVLLVERRRDGEAVVLATEDLRQLVDGREVESLMRVAFRA